MGAIQYSGLIEKRMEDVWESKSGGGGKVIDPAPYPEDPRARARHHSMAAALMRRARPSALHPGWVALVEISARIEAQPYHWPIGRTPFQKIASVATSEGLSTGLQYQRDSFGSFSADLKELEAKLINNGLLQEERGGKMFRVTVEPNFPRVR